MSIDNIVTIPAPLHAFLLDRCNRAREAAEILRLLDESMENGNYVVQAIYRLIHDVACSLDPLYIDLAARGEVGAALAGARRDAGLDIGAPEEETATEEAHT